MKNIFWNHLTFTQFLFAFVVSQVFASKKKKISKMPSSFHINLFDNFPYCFFRLISFGLENLEGHNLFFENESIPAFAYLKGGWISENVFIFVSKFKTLTWRRAEHLLWCWQNAIFCRYLLQNTPFLSASQQTLSLFQGFILTKSLFFNS